MARFNRIINLWRRCNRCHWCGRPTVLVMRPPELQKKIPVREDEATLDHLNDRNAGPRPQMPRGQEATVLACSKCNHQRGAEAQRALPIEELWRRSGSYPSNHPLRGGLDVGPSIPPEKS